MSDNKFISLKQLADEIGFNASSIKKTVVRRGFTPFQLEEGSNKPFYLKSKDADIFKQKIIDENKNRIKVKKTHTIISGVYFVSVPSFKGVDRFKIGWSNDVYERLSTYRTIIPDLKIIAIWQTSYSWCEKAALKCAEQLGKRVHQELFEFRNTEIAYAELDSLFMKMGIKTLIP